MPSDDPATGRDSETGTAGRTTGPGRADASARADGPVPGDARARADGLVRADDSGQSESSGQTDGPVRADALAQADGPVRGDDGRAPGDASVRGDALVQGDATEGGASARGGSAVRGAAVSEAQAVGAGERGSVDARGGEAGGTPPGGDGPGTDEGGAGTAADDGVQGGEVTARDAVSAPGPDGEPRRVTRRFPLFTRDTARPEGGGRAAPRNAPAPARQWPILAVTGTVGLGLLLTALDVFRFGTLLIGLALLAGAAMRWMLPDVGMLAVRSRFTDLVTYGVLGLAIALLAMMAQPSPWLEIPFLDDTLHFTIRT